MPAKRKRNNSPARWKDYFARLHQVACSLSSEQLDDEHKARLLEQLDGLKVLRTLDAEQRDTLANFVFDAAVFVEEPLGSPLRVLGAPRKKWLREKRKSPQQLRKLEAKTAKLRSAFDDLVSYWVGMGGSVGAPYIDEEHPAEGNIYLIADLDELFGVCDVLEDIDTAIGALTDALTVPDAVETSEDDNLWPTVRRARLAMALDDFFRKECGLSDANDSEVRIAKIGNKFWRWQYRFREQYDGVTGWKGCDGVRKLLKRHWPSGP